MVAQLQEPAAFEDWLLPPQLPPRHTINAYGFLLQTDGTHVVSARGMTDGPIGQRIVAASMLRLETREQLAERYGMSIRQIQEIVTGTARAYLTAPVRERLHRLGIGGTESRAYKGQMVIRLVEIRDAHQRLAVLSADMLRDWSSYTNDQRAEVARDLWLLSGAWREHGE